MKGRSKHMESVAKQMRNKAGRSFFDGHSTPSNAKYVEACTRVDHVTGTNLILTLDVGYHTSGWWKNPDYERCLHLSLSPIQTSTITDRFGKPFPVRGELDQATKKLWLETFFHEDLPKVWIEPPYSKPGKQADVWHYRLFCDTNWKPILPRGEVYSKELTDAGWMSASEVYAHEQANTDHP